MDFIELPKGAGKVLPSIPLSCKSAELIDVSFEAGGGSVRMAIHRHWGHIRFRPQSIIYQAAMLLSLDQGS